MTLSQAFLANNGFKTAAEDFRNLVAAIFRGGQGISFPTDFAVTPGSGLSVNYAPGYANVTGTALATQGSYFVWDTTGANLSWPSANPSNPRIDALVLFVCDSQYGTATAPDGAQWVIIQGTPAVSPVAPTNAAIAAAMTGPGGWMRVANVTIAANATSISSGNISMTTYTAGNSRAVQSIVNPNSVAVITGTLQEIFRFYIPANSLSPGQSIDYKASGIIQTGSGAGTNWPIAALYENATTNVVTMIQPASWTTTQAANSCWIVEGTVTCLTTGTSGTISADIRLNIGQNAGSGSDNAFNWTNIDSSYTIDTTNNQYLSVMMAGANGGGWNAWSIGNGRAAKVW